MPLFKLRDLFDLHKELDSIRNVCVLAHVDHGKTTLADSLIAYNQLISPKLSGSLRYLDYREDEQSRGITMKSCGISIVFEDDEDISGKHNEEDPEEKIKNNRYLINLIDSPGHLDFSGEFCAASKISDGALILIDAVEGICTQAIREVCEEKLSPVLVINKMDRLIMELKLDTVDAYKHVCQIIEQVNALIATSHNELCSVNDHSNPSPDGTDDDNVKAPPIALHPLEGNVIFASAIDQWGFGIANFAEFYSKKYKFSQKILNKTLWGDYYIDLKSKTIRPLKLCSKKNQKPMFVELILDNIWMVYNTFIENKDKDMIEKMMKTLYIKVPAYDLKSKDRRKGLRAFMGQWMPLAPSIMKSLVRKVKSPKAFGEERAFVSFNISNEAPEFIINSIRACSRHDSMIVVFCPKMFLISEDAISSGLASGEEAYEQMERRRFANIAKNNRIAHHEQDNSNSNINTELEHDASSDNSSLSDNTYVIVGLARIYSGTLKRGITLHVYGPNYNIYAPNEQTYSFEVESVYALMGREFVEVSEITAGNVFGIRLPDTHSFKTCVISSCSPGYIRSNYERPIPIVRVAVEPQNPAHMQRLVNGLKRLNQSDSSVEVHFSDTGEHIISAIGELHLERCLDDLRNHFSKISIQSSAPIVPFRETISTESGAGNFSNGCIQLYFQRYLKNTASSPQNQQSSNFNTVTLTTSDQLCSITVQSWKIPDSIMDILSAKGMPNAERGSIDTILNKLIESGRALDKENQKPSISWGDILRRIIKVGPGNAGDNILVDYVSGSVSYKGTKQKAALSPSSVDGPHRDLPDSLGQFLEPICSGFDLAVSRGPLCEEQVLGLCFILKGFTVNGDIDGSSVSELSGKIITTMRDACIRSMISWSMRLSLAMYSCSLIVPPESLGKVHAVLGKRGGTIYSEQIKEGTPLFEIKSKLPVINSFGFAQEMRKRTSGVADPQLHFCGFELLDMDPFWVPTTEDELEDLGEKSDRDNLAKKIVDSIRKRKGFFVDEKVIEYAEKQKNIKNK